MGQDDFSQEPVKSSVAKQRLMKTLGATLEKVAAGLVEIAIRPTAAISQQHGFTHAGAVSAIADSAAGYAALTLTSADPGVLWLYVTGPFTKKVAGLRTWIAREETALRAPTRKPGGGTR